MSQLMTTSVDADLKALFEMLRYRRPAGSKTERRFIRRFLTPLGTQRDKWGNHRLAIPMPDGSPSKVIWSSHTDTVHAEGGQQELIIRRGDYIEAVKSNCLGADCTTGVWIMTRMIQANVPGLYLFHYGEEKGCIGSSKLAEHDADLLKQYDFAIAFDRRDTTSVITKQYGSRCCSQAFVDSIVPMLPGKYVADDTGLYTDTASYMEIVPECSNLSVGYADAHGGLESQSMSHAMRLMTAMLKFDESRLVAARVPEATPAAVNQCVFDWGSPWNEAGYQTWTPSQRERDGSWQKSASGVWRNTIGRLFDQNDEPQPPVSLVELLRLYPDEVADWLEQQGIDAEYLMEEIADLRGRGRRQ